MNTSGGSQTVEPNQRACIRMVVAAERKGSVCNQKKEGPLGSANSGYGNEHAATPPLSTMSLLAIHRETVSVRAPLAGAKGVQASEPPRVEQYFPSMNVW